MPMQLVIIMMVVGAILWVYGFVLERRSVGGWAPGGFNGLILPDKAPDRSMDQTEDRFGSDPGKPGRAW